MGERNPQSTPTGGDRIKLNVGGKLFETTAATLRSGGPDSLLSALSHRPDPEPIFIDRDPEIFSLLLSLLRSNRIPSSQFSVAELADEASYYGIENLLRTATCPPPFAGIDAKFTATIKPSSEAVISAFSALSDGSILLAHGGQVSAYDWALTQLGTIRTHLDDIAAIRGVMPRIAALGSVSAPGLHFYSLNSGRRVGSVDWTDPTDPRIYKARVGAIADSEDSVFASFDCPHRENVILQVDKETMKEVAEIGRQKGSSTKTGVPIKLVYLPDPGVIFGCSVTLSAFGYSGYVRLWDPRTGGVVWETNEPGSGRSSRFGDSFADVDVDVEGAMMFKVCSKSGDLGMADLRKLGDDPWVYLVDKNPSMRYVAAGGSSVLHCHKKQVFVGREGGLEVWSRVEEREMNEDRESWFHEEAFRRNFVDKAEDSERGVITKIEGGGDRLFVCREDVEGIEVWESSGFSGVVSV